MIAQAQSFLEACAAHYLRGREDLKRVKPRDLLRAFHLVASYRGFDADQDVELEEKFKSTLGFWAEGTSYTWSSLGKSFYQHVKKTLAVASGCF